MKSKKVFSKKQSSRSKTGTGDKDATIFAVFMFHISFHAPATLSLLFPHDGPRGSVRLILTLALFAFDENRGERTHP